MQLLIEAVQLKSWVYDVLFKMRNLIWWWKEDRAWLRAASWACACVCVCGGVLYEQVPCFSCFSGGGWWLFGLMASSLFWTQGFEPDWLYTGENFGKVLTTLLAVNFATQGKTFALFGMSVQLNSVSILSFCLLKHNIMVLFLFSLLS